MPSRASHMRIPEGWAVEERRAVGHFVTRERYRLPDGSLLTWSSRRHRKTGLLEERHAQPARWWWQPTRLGWWMAVLFTVGSLLFALGAFPIYADHVDPRVVGITYFVGSIFFTSAGYLQYFEAINTPDELEEPRSTVRPHHRSFAWQPSRIDWWSASVQSIGTLWFNVSTFLALDATFSVQQENRLVWAPDFFGSVAFMIASTLAWIEVCHGWWRWQPGDTSWKIVALNLGGSIAFQISAFAAFIRPATGEIANLPIANLGTFVGAVCFFLGALLLIPELADR
jgi:hypothetical protein